MQKAQCTVNPNNTQTINIVEGFIYYNYGSGDNNYYLGYKMAYPNSAGEYLHTMLGVAWGGLHISCTSMTITFSTSTDSLLIYVISLYS